MNPAISGPGPDMKFAIGTVPASAAATVVGSAIDVRGFQFLVLEAITGAATGGPSAQTLDAKVTESDASGGSYTDYVPPGKVAADAAIAQITTDNTRHRKVISLQGCKGFVKISKTLALTGGVTPTLPHYVGVALSGAQVMPSQSDD